MLAEHAESFSQIPRMHYSTLINGFLLPHLTVSCYQKVRFYPKEIGITPPLSADVACSTGFWGTLLRLLRLTGSPKTQHRTSCCTFSVVGWNAEPPEHVHILPLSCGATFPPACNGQVHKAASDTAALQQIKAVKRSEALRANCHPHSPCTIAMQCHCMLAQNG